MNRAISRLQDAKRGSPSLFLMFMVMVMANLPCMWMDARGGSVAFIQGVMGVTYNEVPRPKSFVPMATGKESCVPKESQVSFEKYYYLDLLGRPGTISRSEIETLERMLQETYNELAICEQSGALRMITRIQIVQAEEGDMLGSISSVTLPSTSRKFTYLIRVQGNCLGDCDPFQIVFTSLHEVRRKLSTAALNKEVVIEPTATPPTMLRQQGYDQQEDVRSWKGFYQDRSQGIVQAGQEQIKIQRPTLEAGHDETSPATLVNGIGQEEEEVGEDATSSSSLLLRTRRKLQVCDCDAPIKEDVIDAFNRAIHNRKNSTQPSNIILASIDENCQYNRSGRSC